MDKRQALLSDFDHLEEQTDAILAQLTALKAQVTALSEENAELTVENQHLRELLSENGIDGDDEQRLSKSLQNLERLYAAGFHVCREFYGQRREADDSCAFCLELIYGERERTNKAS
ncbi:DNA replication initiation control protein YabA [Furfurilactobacillus sp. WILCCON 0119]|uniref:DNA replication initiation control protein YabA n=1 Tax=Furfurilactobacillus entadae TaxID=2922307 RepID=UPI0035E9F467